MKRQATIPTLVLLASSIAPGCQPDFVEPEPNPLLQTDRRQYVASYESGEGNYRRYSFKVLAQISNPGPEPMYLERCFPNSPVPIYGVPLVNDQLESAYNAPWACVGHHNPIVVAPGATRLDTLRIVGPYATDGVTGQPLGVLEGRFLLFYSASCADGLDCPLPRPLYRSHSFTVTVAR